MEQENNKTKDHKKASNAITDGVMEILTEQETISQSKHKGREQTFLLMRNGFVLVAAVLFTCSLFIDGTIVLRGVAYILGAVAYFSELLLLTDCFTKRVPNNELFMIYCFGPLYILMGIEYFIEAFF